MADDEPSFIVNRKDKKVAAGSRASSRDRGGDDDDDDPLSSDRLPTASGRGRTQMPARPPVLSDAKKKKLAEASDSFDMADLASAPGLAPGASASAPSLTEERDPHMFYPDTYATFDDEKMVNESEPVKSKKGTGMMLFISYIWPDGVQKPLLVQAPKLFLPGGIMKFEDKDDSGKVSKVNTVALCSLGKEWESNPQMVAFRDLCNKIKKGAARLCFNKDLGEPFHKDLEAVESRFGDLIIESIMYDKQNPNVEVGTYPPSMKLCINTAPNNRSLFVSKLPADPADPTKKRYAQISVDAIGKGSSIVPMVHFQWTFRKKAKNDAKKDCFSFNVHATIYQAVVEVGGQVQIGTDGKLAIVC
jgi:hypothetical protein